MWLDYPSSMMLGALRRVRSLSLSSHAALKFARVCTMKDLQFVVAVSNDSTPVAAKPACICSAQ